MDKVKSGAIVRLSGGDYLLGPVLGAGGFGVVHRATSNGQEFAVKIEPSESAGLFSEMKCVMNMGLTRAAPPNLVRVFAVQVLKEHRLRVMVMSLLGPLPRSPDVVRCGTDILKALEFMHERGYSHGDIKPGNMCVRPGGTAVLIDFGNAARFRVDGVHCKFEPREGRAHDGTLRWASLDAHHGVAVSRRGDLANLMFVLIAWLGELPWHVESERKKSGAQRVKLAKSIMATKSLYLGKSETCDGLAPAEALAGARRLLTDSKVDPAWADIGRLERLIAASFALAYDEVPTYSL